MNPGYLFPQNLLAAWARQRLQLQQLGDGVCAEFRWAGTTCTEPAKPLEFLFEVFLDRTQDGYLIRSSRCCRPDGKGGWRRMCSSQTEPDFIGTVEGESPFEGRLLEETLAWRPEVHPAGCLCSRTSRDHKWQIVFQSIHYALGQLSRS